MTTFSPNDIFQTIATNQISEVKLKDGTIMKISPNTGNSSHNNYNLNYNNYENTYKNKERHNHHQDGIGSFGQHFKTEYSQICPDCIDGAGVLKQRQNYVLYVSKNVTEENISKKNKCDNQMQQQTYPRNNVKIVPQKRRLFPKKGGMGGKGGGRVISQGYVDYNGKPVLEPKIRLRNKQNNYAYNYQQNNGVYNLCQECNAEEEANEEKITKTVKVLVPESGYDY